MRGSRPGIVAVLALLGLTSAASPSGGGEGLVGKTLPVVNDLESGVGSLLGHFLGGGKDLEGTVENVTVTREDPGRLELRVSYTGFEGAKIWAEALDERKRRQREIRSEPIILAPGAAEASLILELDPSREPPAEESLYLNVNVGLARRSTPGLVRTFLLGKSWDAASGGGGPASESAVATLVLDPVPLGDTPLGNVSPPQEPPSGGGGNPPGGGSPGGGASTTYTPPYQYNANILRMALQPKVDLYVLASKAHWSNGSARLPFNGSPSDSKGFVIGHQSKTLNDGKSYDRVLQTHPEWKAHGRAEGTFAFTMPPNASTLDVGLGFLQGANASDGVTFRVTLRHGSRNLILLNQPVRNNQVIEKRLPIPSEAKGKTVRLILSVHAGASSAQDWSAWVYPRIN